MLLFWYLVQRLPFLPCQHRAMAGSREPWSGLQGRVTGDLGQAMSLF